MTREDMADYRTLWEEVGQHIDKAAIGYNHQQIRAVFADNQDLRLAVAAFRQRLEALRTNIATFRADREERYFRLRELYDSGMVDAFDRVLTEMDNLGLAAPPAGVR